VNVFSRWVDLAYDKMIELITRNYQLLGIIKNIKRYVNEYNMCQRMKNCIEVLKTDSKWSTREAVDTVFYNS